ncbi:MAG: HAD hydrolase-like protein, partial [Desulfovibrionaceae bacterium]
MNSLQTLCGQVPAQLAGVIFDCDGVLIDSREANAEYYNRILRALNLPDLTEEQEAYTYMATVSESLAHITPVELQGRLPEICQKNVNYMRDIMPLIRLETGIMDFLTFLIERGVRCAVHTNRSSGMAVVVDAFKLRRYFDPVVTAVMVKPKPAPDGVRYILQ